MASQRIHLSLVVTVLCLSVSVSEFAGAACPFSNPSFGRRSLKQADPAANPGLQFGFYASSCPNLDTIVATTITNYTAQNVFTPGKLLRLFFHDCAVQGCDASILLDSTPPGSAEKDAPISATLDMFYVVDAIKANVEAQCPGVVSCADILALAAVHSVAIAGGPVIQMNLGRRDGTTSYIASATADMPVSTFDVDGLLASFANFGLDINDLVALSGAHTIGEVHCTSFEDRFQGNSPFPDAEFGQELYNLCSGNGQYTDFSVLNRITVMDSQSSTTFDSEYFIDLIQGQGVMTSDQDLYNDPRTQALVMSFATNQNLFFQSFGTSLLKMGSQGVLTGTNGVIRQQCSVP